MVDAGFSVQVSAHSLTFSPE